MAQNQLNYDGVWRVPAEESIDLYPGLVVNDNRQSGSITFGPTRLPVWAVIGEYATNGWEGVAQGWPVEEYGWDNDKFQFFLYCLMELRGEFGRLLLVLADAERCENYSGGAFRKSWWETKKHRKRVREQLKRCLSILEGDYV
jgi:hypothetical protein